MDAYNRLDDSAREALGRMGVLKVSPDPRTLREKLQERKALAEEQLKSVTAILDLLDAHPEFEQFLDLFKAQGL